jgi:glycosyltransferase involved in cell wall biosynthesis
MSRILFDAYWFVSGPPSGRNVLRSIIETWLSDFPDDQVTLALPKGEVAAVKAFLGRDSAAVEFMGLRAKPHGVSVLLEIDPSNYDAVLTQNFVPYRGRRVHKGVFVHDVIYRRHPEWFSWVERRYLELSLRSARRADTVFTSSRSESDQILRSFGIRSKAPRVTPVGLALAQGFERSEAQRPDKLGAASRFLLTVGRLNARKNVAFCASSLLSAGLISPEVPLVVVGAPDGRADSFTELQGAIDAGSVVFTGHVSDGELKWLYENTELFVFPSLDEGFGLPILEARFCGSRMAVSDIPSFREVGPEASFFDPRSASSISQVVARALQGSELAHQPGVKTETWSEIVARMRSVLLSTGEESR